MVLLKGEAGEVDHVVIIENELWKVGRSDVCEIPLFVGCINGSVLAIGYRNTVDLPSEDVMSQ